MENYISLHEIQTNKNEFWKSVVLQLKVWKRPGYRYDLCRREINSYKYDGNFVKIILYNYDIRHCVKSVHVWSYSGPYFPAFGLNIEVMRENTDQNNSEYGHFLRSAP